MRVDPKHGKQARTAFEVREQFRGFTLVECRPFTGRTHQIRVHLKHWGLPICGDRVYGGRPLLLSELKDEYRLKPGKTERPLIATVALHADEPHCDEWMQVSPTCRVPGVTQSGSLPASTSAQGWLARSMAHALRPATVRVEPGEK